MTVTIERDLGFLLKNGFFGYNQETQRIFPVILEEINKREERKRHEDCCLVLAEQLALLVNKKRFFDFSILAYHATFQYEKLFGIAFYQFLRNAFKYPLITSQTSWKVVEGIMTSMEGKKNLPSFQELLKKFTKLSLPIQRGGVLLIAPLYGMNSYSESCVDIIIGKLINELGVPVEMLVTILPAINNGIKNISIFSQKEVNQIKEVFCG